MLYITKRYVCETLSFVNAVYESPFEDLKEQYRAELVGIAKADDLIVNPHHPTIPMNHNHNSHLTKEEYNKKIKHWDKFTYKFTFDFFIIKNKKKFKITIHQFTEI